MARPLPIRPMQKLHFIPGPVLFLIALATVFSVFAAVTFLCGSHTLSLSSRSRGEKRTVRLGDKKERVAVLQKMHSSLSSKALLMAKMISWRKVQDEGGQEEEEGRGESYEDGGEDDAVWKKTIIKGEKCRPLDFSGKILYDAEGNLLPD